MKGSLGYCVGIWPEVRGTLHGGLPDVRLGLELRIGIAYLSQNPSARPAGHEWWPPRRPASWRIKIITQQFDTQSELRNPRAQ